MHKLIGIICLMMGMVAGMNITSNTWNPSEEKIPVAILYIAIALIWIFVIGNRIKTK